VRQFETGATRDSNDDKVDYRCLSIRAIRRFADYMHKHRIQADGSRRDADNYKKGIPVEAYLESGQRHMVEWMSAVEEGRLDDAEELACAIWFNLQGWLHERAGWVSEVVAVKGWEKMGDPWECGGPLCGVSVAECDARLLAAKRAA
jgi:hypothetical protein